jgi:tRNA(Ile)-lysidine synthase
MGNNGQNIAPEGSLRDWPAQAEVIARHIPLAALHPRAVAELLAEAHNDAGSTIGIACSGGADSLALLLLVYAHFPELRNRLAVLHFDHRIRGEESAADARFVAAVAESLGLRLESGQWEHSSPDAPEDAARAARMTFLHEKARILLFGHNKTDVAETLLLRLGRGSSLDGLAGPRPVQRFRNKPGVLHLRPLLNLSGPAIRTEMTACDIPWREDSTNAALRYTRNKLRHEVLPLLDAALGRDWTAAAAKSREKIEEADEFLNAAADRILQGAPDELPAPTLANAAPALARRILERWLDERRLRENVPAATLDRLLEAATLGAFPKDLNAPGLEISDSALRQVSDTPAAGWTEIAAAPNCEIFFPDGASLRIQPVELRPDEIENAIAELKAKGSTTDILVAANPDATFTLRPAKNGDVYRPLGAPGRAKLHDMQTNRKIPPSERRNLPVVLEENRIVWSPFLLPADEFKLDAATTHAVRLTYRNISPASGSYKRNAD